MGSINESENNRGLLSTFMQRTCMDVWFLVSSIGSKCHPTPPPSSGKAVQERSQKHHFIATLSLAVDKKSYSFHENLR